MNRIIFKLIALFLLNINIALHAQIEPLDPIKFYPLTATNIPKGSYKKDLNDELSAFEGTWKGQWEDKTIIIKFKKQVGFYNSTMDIYMDNLIAKFQVKDSKGNILFDTINTSNKNILFRGLRLFSNGKYGLGYRNYDLCGIGGYVDISFTDASKTRLKLFYMTHSVLIDSDCPYHNKKRPEPFPIREDLILTKQK